MQLNLAARLPHSMVASNSAPSRTEARSAAR